jgi:hypothetical protein
MTESGDPLENAIAERMNGILKNRVVLCLPTGFMAKFDKLCEQSH